MTLTARRGRLAVAAALPAAVLVLAGCVGGSSSGSPRSSSSPSPAPASASASTSVAPPSPSSTANAATGTPASTLPAPVTGVAGPTTGSPPPNSTHPGAAQTAGCPTGHLRVTVQRGGGIAGREYALITFTNITSQTCQLDGYPGVSLRAGGKLLGQPAGRSGASYQPVRLGPGAQAQAQVTVTTTCEAPVSDTMRIYPPNQSAYVDVPMQLRGCSSTVAPTAAS